MADGKPKRPQYALPDEYGPARAPRRVDDLDRPRSPHRPSRRVLPRTRRRHHPRRRERAQPPPARARRPPRPHREGAVDPARHRDRRHRSPDPGRVVIRARVATPGHRLALRPQRRVDPRQRRERDREHHRAVVVHEQPASGRRQPRPDPGAGNRRGGHLVHQGAHRDDHAAARAPAATDAARHDSGTERREQRGRLDARRSARRAASPRSTSRSCAPTRCTRRTTSR